MNLGYQRRDIEIVDYQLYRLEDNIFLRGPQLENTEPGSFFSCIGAAQTFGCFCEKPYPTLLHEHLGLPVMNMGIAGAGPAFFLRRKRLLDSLNASRFVIIQVMSGRSADNSLFESGGLEYLMRRADGARIGAEPAYHDLLINSRTCYVQQIVAETRENWVASYRELLQRISAPKILLWFSKRDTAYTEDVKDVHSLFGEFPQLVNDTMMDQISGMAEKYVKCITSRGSPQPLISRFTGKPTSITGRADLGARKQEHNTYYPSPGMHSDAAEALEPACNTLLQIAD